MIYKSKAKKMQSINEANGISNLLRGKDDWYKRLKARNTLQ